MTPARSAPELRPVVAPYAARVRPLVAADVPDVARLHRTVFGVSTDPGAAAYRDYFTRVFLDHADRQGGIASLVYQESDGRIAGFVGVVPRRVTLHGRHYQAAISSQFVVDPASNVGLVALRLVKTFLDGPQDLSIADEANDVSRRIWEGLGGSTAGLLSLYWTRVLRPAQLARAWLRGRRGVAPVAAAAGPLARLADSLALRLPASPFRPPPSSAAAEPLHGSTLVAHAPKVFGAHALRVEYDAPAWQSLLDRTARRAGRGPVLNRVITTGSVVAGWYIGHIDGNGVADIAQVAAAPSAIRAVLDHLFRHACQEGAVSVSGRLDAGLMQALSDTRCWFHRRGPWVLFKATRPELVHAMHSGATCLSRVDGEWALRFHPHDA